MLDDIKQNYISMAGTKSSSTTPIELVDKYFSVDSHDKNQYLAQLILYCWPALEKLFYKQTVKVLSEEECYDIFIDAFFYVIQHQVWKDENSSLYQDKDALLKAMYTTVESRRRNFFVAQNRQKRQVNQFPISLDGLSEEFQDGYFLPVDDSYNIDKGWSVKYIYDLWEQKLYVTAVVFHLMLTCDVYTEDNKISNKKIKKLLKYFDKMCYNDFINIYGLKDTHGDIYDKYIKNMSDTMMYQYIQSAINMFQDSDTLKHIYDNQLV